MTILTQTSFGQPAESCLPADKWTLLAALTESAAEHGLNHRTLTVLRALLSFFPDRALPADPGSAVVFPSNRTLSARLNGMPESTLRRHLGNLVRCGIVSRQDSPNRKRFARRHGIPFGFDLSPLARAASSLVASADAAREKRDRLAALRDRLALIRIRLRETDRLAEDHPLMEQARLTLRRKIDEETLRALIDALESHLEPAADKPAVPALCAAKMSGGDSRYERHIQNTNRKESVSKTPPVDKSAPPKPVALAELLDTCREYKSYFPDTKPTWHGLIAAADQLHMMLGIDRSTYETARQRLGAQNAAGIILCMLERIAHIRRPGAYLAGLLRRAGEGRLNMAGLMAAAGSGQLSADNPA